MSKKAVSQRRRWRRGGQAFSQWLEASSCRLICFRRLAVRLELYISDHLASISDPASFAEALPVALKACDEDIYGCPATVLAYAHLHLLERYRRFWALLEQLVGEAVLPLRTKGISVVDVGMGPAPASFAIQDFYASLMQYAHDFNPELTPGPTRYSCIERSELMTRFIHELAQLSGRPGPFQAKWHDIKGVDPLSDHRAEKDARIRQIELEDDTSWEYAKWYVNTHETEYHESWFYDIIVASNFLTHTEQIEDQRSEWANLLTSLRPGGLFIVLGATHGEYPRIYRALLELASANGLRPMGLTPRHFQLDDDSPEAAEITKSFRKRWQALTVTPDPRLSAVISELATLRARDVFDPHAEYRTPGFCACIFRRGHWPGG